MRRQCKQHRVGDNVQPDGQQKEQQLTVTNVALVWNNTERIRRQITGSCNWTYSALATEKLTLEPAQIVLDKVGAPLVWQPRIVVDQNRDAGQQQWHIPSV